MARKHGVATEPSDVHTAEHFPCRRGRERRDQSLSLVHVYLYRFLLFLLPPRLSLPGTLPVLMGLLDCAGQRPNQQCFRHGLWLGHERPHLRLDRCNVDWESANDPLVGRSSHFCRLCTVLLDPHSYLVLHQCR